MAIRLINNENVDLMTTMTSRMMLDEPSQQFVYKQCVDFTEEFGKMEGDTIRLLRYPFLPEAGLTQEERTISYSQTIGTNNGIRLTAEAVFISLIRFGGPYNDVENVVAPLVLSERECRYAQTVIPLINWDDAHSRMEGTKKLWKGIGGERLKRDFDLWEDVIIQLLLGGVTRKYNPADIADGSVNAQKIVPTVDFPNLKEICSDQRMTPGADGLYRFFASPRMVKHFKQDTALREELSRSMNGQRMLERGEIGIYEGFKIIESNNMSPKTVNAKSAHLGYITGDKLIGAGVGMPLQTRVNSNDDYQTKAFLIWLMDGGYTLLDSRLGIEVRTYGL
jgi:hypothetical protein